MTRFVNYEYRILRLSFGVSVYCIGGEEVWRSVDEGEGRPTERTLTFTEGGRGRIKKAFVVKRDFQKGLWEYDPEYGVWRIPLTR